MTHLTAVPALDWRLTISVQNTAQLYLHDAVIHLLTVTFCRTRARHAAAHFGDAFYRACRR